MGVEENNLKSTSINEEENKKPNPNLKEDEVEIAEEDTTLPSPNNDIVGQPHLLEHFLYNNIHHPSKLAVGADFHCFKYKIEPKWDDPVCANGGKWTVTFHRGKSDMCWLYTLLALIEQFDYGDEICGAVVNVKGRQEKIALWTKNAANETAQISIGKQWKEILDHKETIGFIFHVICFHTIIPLLSI
ncbi:Eukaryotic translation initiation factor 4E-1 [Hibiscus syriacus]|uniref:Eukaryotic translation initiation factor 4E-1 n=1 Tax=Hibiscus syriacus TaxID=106335 RepID=A0A6A2Z969_HIBSY|nr:Eukaryotic translation initiation factor 4E-1 [Hibiscus syriacus]